MKEHKNITEALKILKALGLPRAQQNERSALCLLALLNLTPKKKWAQAEASSLGITPIMDWARKYYHKDYAPNTRETVRRQTIHQFVDAGIAIYNPDDPSRPVNSPKAVYQITPDTLALLKTYGETTWKANLKTYLSKHQTLADHYAQERDMRRIPIQIASGKNIQLSPGEHSELIKAVIEDFAPRFVPDGVLVYAGDTGEKWGYFDDKLLAKLGVVVDSHGKMPDVVIYYPKRNWLLLV
ncbi:MAG: BsuBI/PstI family type II restriction endonuclease, partial [Euryarchaeota archaeon]